MGDIASCTLEELARENQVNFTQKQNIYLKIKRILDFIGSLVALILLSPIFLIIAILIKVASPKETVIFRQKRIGQFGQPFWIYKFRSMKQGTPELGTSEFKNPDKYITKVGKFIRKTSLDELPQLFCCIIGTMSLCGPRPLLARENEIHFLRSYYGVYQVKPGITGLAQINGRDKMDIYEKTRWDRSYVQNVSLSLDAKILMKTVLKVLRREGFQDNSSCPASKLKN